MTTSIIVITLSLNTQVAGSVNDAANGSFNSNGVGFFGQQWTATQTAWFDTHDTPLTWSGTSPLGAFSYDFTLTGNQVAAGLGFDWSTNIGIPVLAVFDCGSTVGSTCVWVDSDGTGWGGTSMVTSPFPGQTAAFQGVANDVFPDSGGAPIPIPAAVWLFGSGLVGLAGVARRKKQA